MEDKANQEWRGVVRKLKQARKRKERLTEKLSKIPTRLTNVRKPTEDVLYQLNIDISVLELKEARLKPKKVNQ
jgi:hypothetical protein